MYVQILVRWIHIIATIFWIGATLYLSRMGRSIVSSEPEEEMGTVLGVHSGAVWQYRKLRKLPEGKKGQQEIHWFKWESLVSWLSGVILFILVYWRGGVMYSEVITQNQAIALGAAVIVAAVVFYGAFWHFIPATQTGSKAETIGAIVSYVVMVAFVYILGQYLSGRAVWMHLAVVFGTIMAIQNVWFTILPSQREILAIMHDGGTRNEELATRAFRCTKHNTYMMVPLVLMMMSNHYPTILYGTDHDWLVIAVTVLIGGAGAHLIRTKF